MENVYGESKLAFHKNKLEAFLNKDITAPIYVRIKPTNKCNHHCFYCGYEIDKGRDSMDRATEIPFEKLMEVLMDFKEMGVKAVTYSGGGEPLVYSWIEKIMQTTLNYGINLSVITNGQSLREEKAEILSQAKWVRISSDASDAKSFSEIRRVPEIFFADLTENIRNFARMKKSTCELGINFVVQEKNAGKVYNSIKHFRDLGVDHIKITPCWMPNFEEYHKNLRTLVTQQVEIAREDFEEDGFRIYDTYEKDFEHCGINKRKYKKCYHMQTVPVIAADSNVYFCHDKAYKPDGVLGSIMDMSFKELWFSDGAKKIFNTFNPKRSCNHHCANDQRNIMTHKMLNDLDNLEKYKPASDKHKNFI